MRQSWAITELHIQNHFYFQLKLNTFSSRLHKEYWAHQQTCPYIRTKTMTNLFKILINKQTPKRRIWNKIFLKYPAGSPKLKPQKRSYGDSWGEIKVSRCTQERMVFIFTDLKARFIGIETNDSLNKLLFFFCTFLPPPTKNQFWHFNKNHNSTQL